MIKVTLTKLVNVNVAHMFKDALKVSGIMYLLTQCSAKVVIKYLLHQGMFHTSTMRRSRSQRSLRNIIRSQKGGSFLAAEGGGRLGVPQIYLFVSDAVLKADYSSLPDEGRER